MIRIYRTYPNSNTNIKSPNNIQNIPEKRVEQIKEKKEEPREQRGANFEGKQKKKGSFFERVIPREIFDAKTGKLFGVLSFEDLLLIALIFILSGSEEEEDRLLLYVFLYVLLSDYIDLSDIF